MNDLHIRISALLGFIAVVCGASGAHGSLHDYVVAHGELGHWETAVLYHLLHAVVLTVLAIAGSRGGTRVVWAWRCILIGIVLFSGSLYVLALTQQSWLGAVTPLGGLFLLLGWLLVALARWERPQA